MLWNKNKIVLPLLHKLLNGWLLFSDLPWIKWTIWLRLLDHSPVFRCLARCHVFVTLDIFGHCKNAQTGERHFFLIWILCRCKRLQSEPCLGIELQVFGKAKLVNWWLLFYFFVKILSYKSSYCMFIFRYKHTSDVM